MPEHPHEHQHEHGGHSHHDHGDHAHDEHQHGHQHGFNAASLLAGDAVYHDVYQQIVRWLSLAQGTRALDAGSGAGGMTALLAKAVGNDGNVTALDVNEELLAVARRTAGSGPYAARVLFQVGDLAGLPFEAGSFDLVWSSHTVHHVPDQLAVLRELKRVLTPGGRLALREGGIHARLLPDDIGICEPGLEDRLAAAFHVSFQQHARGDDAVRYPFGWTHALADAGFNDVTAKSFLLEALPPFTDAQIRYCSRHLRRWIEDDERRALLSAEDVAALKTLTDPQSEHYVFGRDDLHLTNVVTVYAGTV